MHYGHNRELLEACKPLSEYSWFINEIRKNQKEGNSLEKSVESAINSMPDSYVIKPIILKNRSEVKRMCITEFNKEKFLRCCELEAERERERADRIEAEAKAEISKAKSEVIKVRSEVNKIKSEAEKEKIQAELISIRNLMNSINMSAEDVMKSMGFSPEKIKEYKKLLGM